MIVAAIETATLGGSVAIGSIHRKGWEVLFSKQWVRGRSHGEVLTATLEEGMSLSEISIEQVDEILLDIGPGSFTGIRVGLATAKALAYGLSKPVRVTSSLGVLALQTPPQPKIKSLFCAINAHKSQVYGQEFVWKNHEWMARSEAKAYPIKGARSLFRRKTLLVGDAIPVLQEAKELGPRSCFVTNPAYPNRPFAWTLIQMRAMQTKNLKKKSWENLEALYIRQSEAEEKLKAGLLKPLPVF